MKKLLTGLILIPVALIGCGGQKPEKERFIGANKEMTCLLLKAGDVFDPTLEQKSKDILKKFGFDIDDKVALKAISDKYKDDVEVNTAIEAAVVECGGPDLSKKLEGIAAPADAAKTETKAEAKTDATVKTPVTPAK